MSERSAIMAGRFIKKQLMEVSGDEAGISPDDPQITRLLHSAGGGLSGRWLERLAQGLVGKITIRHLIGLRRLTDEPLDTILGLEYTHPENRGRMAGLKRIRHELGGYKPKTKKYLCELASCSYPIISRIERFSTWAVLNNAAHSLITPASVVDKALYETFSVDVLIRLKYAIHCNIDDIVGLGGYDEGALFLVGKDNGLACNNKEVPDSDIMDTEAKKAHDAKIIAQFATSRAAKQDSDTITGFSPKAI